MGFGCPSLMGLSRVSTTSSPASMAADNAGTGSAIRLMATASAKVHP